ncbi:MAG TPA: tail fiber domain-containing protein [Chitinophagaceae bacterium]|jgi:hypothetical protein
MKSKLLQFSATSLLAMMALTASSQTSWLITGNTASTTNFIGTKNNQPLIFKTNNIERMRLTKNGQLGIGIINPTSPLQIQNQNADIGISVINPTLNIQDDRIGLFSSSLIAPGYGYGIYVYGGYTGARVEADAGNYGGSAYGLYGVATGTAGARYGVYGVAGGGSFNAAGYFDGDVYANRYLSISDRKFKTSITPLQNSLDQLMKLKPSTYQFKTANYPRMSLPGGKQIGLIADEVKQVFPELVQEAVQPAEYGKDKKEVIRQEEKFESVNYIGLIPVLIGSIQEQQKTIDDLKTQNQELKSRLSKIEQMLTENSGQQSPASAAKLSIAHLEQNAPNPFNQNTVIKYYLPQNTSNAIINITDANGRLIKTVPVTIQGNGQLTLDGGQLTSGIYQYSLIANGKLLDTKKMVLTK